MGYEDALSVLGLEGGEDADRVKRAYLKLVKQHGPDKDPQRFREIREAFDVVRNTNPAAPPARASEPPPPAREPIRDPWALLRAPPGFIVHLASTSEDLEERIAALTALVELGAFAEAASLFKSVMGGGRSPTHARAFVLACRTVTGLHALGMHDEGVTLKNAITAHAGVPPPRSFLDVDSAGRYWTLAWECDQAALISKPLCRLAACLSLGLPPMEAALPFFSWRDANPLEYRRAIDDLERAAPALYGAVREPLAVAMPPAPVANPTPPERPRRLSFPWRGGLRIVAVALTLAAIRFASQAWHSADGQPAANPGVRAPASLGRSTEPGVDGRAGLVEAGADLLRAGSAHADQLPPELVVESAILATLTHGNRCNDMQRAYADLERSTHVTALPSDFTAALSRIGALLPTACEAGVTP